MCCRIDRTAPGNGERGTSHRHGDERKDRCTPRRRQRGHAENDGDGDFAGDARHTALHFVSITPDSSWSQVHGVRRREN
jgi:hypothetical protein